MNNVNNKIIYDLKNRSIRISIKQIKTGSITSLDNYIREKINSFNDFNTIYLNGATPCIFSSLREIVRQNKVNIISTMRPNKSIKKMAICQICRFFDSCSGTFYNIPIEPIPPQVKSIEDYRRRFSLLRARQKVEEKRIILLEERVLGYIKAMRDIQSFPLEFSIAVDQNMKVIKAYRYVLGMYEGFRDTEFILSLYSIFLSACDLQKIKNILNKYDLERWQPIFGIDYNNELLLKLYLRRLIPVDRRCYLVRYTLKKDEDKTPIIYYYYFSKMKNETKGLYPYLKFPSTLKDSHIAYNTTQNPPLPMAIHINLLANNIFSDYVLDILKLRAIFLKRTILSYVSIYYNRPQFNLYYL